MYLVREELDGLLLNQVGIGDKITLAKLEAMLLDNQIQELGDRAVLIHLQKLTGKGSTAIHVGEHSLVKQIEPSSPSRCSRRKRRAYIELGKEA